MKFQARSSRESDKTGLCMERANFPGQTDRDMKENENTAFSLEKAPSNVSLEKPTLEIGYKESTTAMESWNYPIRTPL